MLNAKYHEKEAEIVAQAGKKGAVTIATNMAGRGTDIVLGGNAEYMAKSAMRKKGYTEEQIIEADGFGDTDNEEILDARRTYRELVSEFKAKISDEAKAVKDAGGLFIIGTERHESRRIDNQLRGRSGRQGDPGASRFYLSMEDDLMRIFGSERLMGIVESLGMPEDQPIEAKILSNSIETAQKKVEGRNFDTRKHVLQYDDVMNQQRNIIYKQRREVLDGSDLKSSILKMFEDVIAEAVGRFCGVSEYPDDWDFDGLRQAFLGLFLTKEDLVFDRDGLERLSRDGLKGLLMEKARAMYDAKERQYGPETMRELERVVLLRVVDRKWMDHIDMMDELRRGIGLRAYGQRDPVVEYKHEGFEMFDTMIREIKEDTARYLCLAQIKGGQELKREQVAKPTTESLGGDGTVKKEPVRRSAPKVGRNDPCPCGSGKKYKKCCGQ